MSTENTIPHSASDLDDKQADKPTADAKDLIADNDSSLEALAREEQSYVRERLRQELGREPTQEEADQWLNEHTEGY